MVYEKFANELAKETTFTQRDTRKFIQAFFKKLMSMPVGERVNFETYGVFHSKRKESKQIFSPLPDLKRVVTTRPKKFLHFKQSRNVDLAFDEAIDK